MKTFKEWFLISEEEDFKTFEADYYAGQFSHIIENAWDYQQERIDKLGRENSMLTGVLADYLDRETIEKYKKELK